MFNEAFCRAYLAFAHRFSSCVIRSTLEGSFLVTTIVMMAAATSAIADLEHQLAEQVSLIEFDRKAQVIWTCNLGNRLVVLEQKR